MPKTISLVKLSKTRYNTLQPIYTASDTPEGLYCKIIHRFRLRGTAVKQLTYELLARVTLIARTSTIIAFYYWTSLCTKLLVAPESTIAVNIPS